MSDIKYKPRDLSIVNSQNSITLRLLLRTSRSTLHWSDDQLALQPSGPMTHWSYVPFVLLVGNICPTFHWTYDPLVLLLAGLMPQWPDALMVHFIGPTNQSEDVMQRITLTVHCSHDPLILRPWLWSSTLKFMASHYISTLHKWTSVHILRIELTYQLSKFSFLRNFHVLLSR